MSNNDTEFATKDDIQERWQEFVRREKDKIERLKMSISESYANHDKSLSIIETLKNTNPDGRSHQQKKRKRVTDEESVARWITRNEDQYFHNLKQREQQLKEKWDGAKQLAGAHQILPKSKHLSVKHLLTTIEGLRRGIRAIAIDPELRKKYILRDTAGDDVGLMFLSNYKFDCPGSVWLRSEETLARHRFRIPCQDAAAILCMLGLCREDMLCLSTNILHLAPRDRSGVSSVDMASTAVDCTISPAITPLQQDIGPPEGFVPQLSFVTAATTTTAMMSSATRAVTTTAHAGQTDTTCFTEDPRTQLYCIIMGALAQCSSVNIAPLRIVTVGRSQKPGFDIARRNEIKVFWEDVVVFIRLLVDPRLDAILQSSPRECCSTERTDRADQADNTDHSGCQSSPSAPSSPKGGHKRKRKHRVKGCVLSLPDAAAILRRAWFGVEDKPECPPPPPFSAAIGRALAKPYLSAGAAAMQQEKGGYETLGTNPTTNQTSPSPLSSIASSTTRSLITVDGAQRQNPLFTPAIDPRSEVLAKRSERKLLKKLAVEAKEAEEDKEAIFKPKSIVSLSPLPSSSPTTSGSGRRRPASVSAVERLYGFRQRGTQPPPAEDERREVEGRHCTFSPNIKTSQHSWRSIIQNGEYNHSQSTVYSTNLSCLTNADSGIEQATRRLRNTRADPKAELFKALVATGRHGHIEDNIPKLGEELVEATGTDPELVAAVLQSQRLERDNQCLNGSMNTNASTVETNGNGGSNGKSVRSLQLYNQGIKALERKRSRAKLQQIAEDFLGNPRSRKAIEQELRRSASANPNEQRRVQASGISPLSSLAQCSFAPYITPTTRYYKQNGPHRPPHIPPRNRPQIPGYTQTLSNSQAELLLQKQQQHAHVKHTDRQMGGDGSVGGDGRSGSGSGGRNGWGRQCATNILGMATQTSSLHGILGAKQGAASEIRPAEAEHSSDKDSFESLEQIFVPVPSAEQCNSNKRKPIMLINVNLGSSVAQICVREGDTAELLASAFIQDNGLDSRIAPLLSGLIEKQLGQFVR